MAEVRDCKFIDERGFAFITLVGNVGHRDDRREPSGGASAAAGGRLDHRVCVHRDSGIRVCLRSGVHVVLPQGRVRKQQRRLAWWGASPRGGPGKVAGEDGVA